VKVLVTGGTGFTGSRELGISFRDVAESLHDTLVWMYRAGHLTAAQVGRIADVSSRR
jgi:hypothetical protein